MANPAALTITELAANSSVAQPSAQSIDTTGMVPIDAGSLTDRMIIEVINTDDAALTVKVNGGDNPPAHATRDLSVALSATGGGTDKKIIGPFESGRFVQDDGKINVTFTPATGAPACSVRVYRLPKV